MRSSHLPALLATLLLAAASAGAQQSSHLLVLDQDAGYVDVDNAGAVLNVDLYGSVASVPDMEASASGGAPFQQAYGIAVSPIDGRAYVADLGRDSVAPINVIPKIIAIDAVTGAIEVIAQGPPLVQPYSLAFMPDGRLLIADAEADPGFLGDSGGCGLHGAIFVIDTATCSPPCIPSVLSDGTDNVVPTSPRSAFGNPGAVVYDPVTDRVYVADNCASAVGGVGSVFQVDPTTGRVALVSSSDLFSLLVAIDVRPDGTPLVVDQNGLGDSVVWTIDLGNSDPLTNATAYTAGTQYSQIEDVSVDAANRVFLVDSGEYDDVAGEFVISPAVWTVDDLDPDPDTNGRKVNESAALTTPISCAIVPIPKAIAVTPPLVAAPTTVIIQGEGLFPSLLLDLGYGAAISMVDYAPGYPKGTALQALVTPTGAFVVPEGCGFLVDLQMEHPFGGTGSLADALSLPGTTGGIVPGNPASTKGDVNDDGLVDGVDLALLGLHYGTEYCDGLSFLNDADFDNSDLIDGDDLAVLATYFGTRP